MKRFFILCLILIFTNLACKEREISVVFPKDRAIDTLYSQAINSDIFLKVIVSDKEYDFLFDTGSEFTLLDSSITSIKLPSANSNLYDVYGNFLSVSQVMLDTLKIGNIKIIELDSYLQRHLRLDGVLGNDILNQLIWKIDFVNNQILVTQNLSNLDIKGDGIPFSKTENGISLAIKINGKEIEAFLDTGFDGFICVNNTLIDQVSSIGSHLVFWEDGEDLHSGNVFEIDHYSPKLDTTYYMPANVLMGDLKLEDEIIKLQRIKFNLIGIDFLKRFEYVTIDYPGKKIYFGKQRGKSLVFLLESFLRLNSQGVILADIDSMLLVKGISSNAKELGLGYMDTVLSINDVSIINRDDVFYHNVKIKNPEHSATEYHISQYNRLVDNVHLLQDTSTIEVKRGGGSHRVTLVRQFNFVELPEYIVDSYLDLRFYFLERRVVRSGSFAHYVFDTRGILSKRLGE